MTLCAFMHPNARIEVFAGAGSKLSDAARKLCASFARDTGEGLLALQTCDSLVAHSPELSFLQQITTDVLRAICAAAGNGTELPAPKLLQPWRDEERQRLLAAAPPLPGTPIDASLLDELALRIHTALAKAITAHGNNLRSFLQSLGPSWADAGRVCLHLAENPRDPSRPFAFLATFAQSVGEGGRVSHQPIGRAIQESAQAADRTQLTRLLLPFKEAAIACPWLAALIESGAIYRPLFWTPREALEFLHDVSKLEACGLSVRVPDWWRSDRPPRPRVQISIGDKAPSRVGLNALLSFDIKVALGDDALSAEELAALKEAGAGLVLLKGRWVEVDPEKLQQVLDHWERARDLASEGVPFHKAMRLLAGLPLALSSAPSATAHEEDTRAWSDVTAGDWLAQALHELRSPQNANEADPGAELKAQLRPYQRAGIQWLWTLHRLGLGACLADDMGLGKTIQIIGFLLTLRRAKQGFRALIVMPASLLGNWTSEFARFAPSISLSICHASSQRKRGGQLETAPTAPGELAAPPSDVVLTTYGMLMREEHLRATHWDVVVLDEAQAIKNAATLQTRTVKTLRAGQKIALTGTPVENGLNDLWSLFDFINPGLLGGASTFRDFLRSAGEGEAKVSRFGSLRALVQPYLLRRLKSDKKIVGDLPDKIELTAWCSLVPRQAAAYQRAVDELAGRLKESSDEKQRRGLVLSSLMRLKQICNHPSQASGDLDFNPDDSGKLARLAELVDAIKAARERLLIFTQFKEMTGVLADFLARRFGREGLILDGDTAVRARAQRVAAFQDEKGPPFFILSLKAGGVGLNLTAAAHVVHFDRWWNPAVENQATDRAYRIGQTRTVMVHKMVCRGTIEERIDRLIADKRELAGDILGTQGIDVKLTEMSDADLLNLVSLDLTRV